jgi:hypothetical protein
VVYALSLIGKTKEECTNFDIVYKTDNFLIGELLEKNMSEGKEA